MRIPSLQTYNSILASTALTCIGILVTTVGITTGLNNYSFVKKQYQHKEQSLIICMTQQKALIPITHW